MDCNIEEMCKWMRYEIIELAHKAGKRGAHLGSALSCVEIMACLYGKVLDVSPNNCLKLERDVFIPSKAHCVLSYYTALAYCGFISKSQLELFEENLSELSGHPVMNLEKGIEFSGGSLGMGFSQAVGVALGMRHKKINNQVYVLLGDGECDEGANWEAAQSAAHYQLQNLTVIVDANGLQYDGFTKDVMDLKNLRKKFEAFGFYALEVDGNDIIELIDAFAKTRGYKCKQPRAIIANTIKGKGISFMENNKKWHHGILTDQDYIKAIQELGDQL